MNGKGPEERSPAVEIIERLKELKSKRTQYLEDFTLEELEIMI